MRKSIFFKLIFCFAFISISMFTLLNTLGVKLLNNQLTINKKNLLYSEASIISSEYMKKYYTGEINLNDLSNELKAIDIFINARIWVLDKNGVILLDSRGENTIIGININDISPDFLSYTYVTNATLKDILPEKSIRVVYRVSSNYTTKGFVVIHYPNSLIHDDAINYADIINICYLIFLIVMLITFAYIYIITVFPLKKITIAAKEYSLGHFNYNLSTKSNDEYKDLSDAVSFMASELQNLDDYQKTFVANISHDFRSPLTSIKGYAEAILDGTIPHEMQNKYLDIILFETERLTKLTTNLLSLNNFENNGVILDITTFDINNIIKQTAASFEGICTKKKITFNLVFSAKILMVEADMGKIQQVLYNLIDNAIKFSHSNSKIKVSTEEKSDKVFIAVKDYGIGIPKDSIKKIWERFYKTDTSRGKDKKGTGLGLSITKEIINSHNENINVISTEGVGTEFIFSLKKADI